MLMAMLAIISAQANVAGVATNVGLGNFLCIADTTQDGRMYRTFVSMY